MAEVQNEQNIDTTSQMTSPSSTSPRVVMPAASSGRSLETSQGRTTIEDPVVAKIVDIAAREIDGVYDLTASGAGAAISNFAGGLTSRVTGTAQRGQSVNVEVGQREAAVDISMVVLYGYNIPQIADSVRRNIINRVGAMTGLVMKEVNITVTDLFFPEDEVRRQQRQQQQQQPQQPRVQ